MQASALETAGQPAVTTLFSQRGMPVLLAALLLGLLNPTGSAMAQNDQESGKQFVPKKDCSYNFTDLPYHDIMESGQVSSLHEFVCRWAVIRNQPGASFALNTYLNPLDSLKVNPNTRSYLIEMEAPNMGDKINWYDEIYVLVTSHGKVYYSRLPGKRTESNEKWHVRSFRTIDVPGAKREYLWPEFYEATPDRESDTTYVGWLAYVHTFHPGDQPSLQPMDAFVPISSADSRASNRDTITRSSIPIRTWDVVDEQKTEISQIDVRFTGPKTIEVTPRTDSLTSGHRAWLGTFRLRSWEKLKD